MTNTRYADDILLYARSLEELQRMAELLIVELKFVGLELNASKTKILHADSGNADVIFDVAEIDGAFVEILHGEAFHRYLGRRINLSAARYDIEFNDRKQQAWFAFKSHEYYY